MKKVTFSADEDLIQQAMRVARTEHTTLSAAFREWLAHYAAQSGSTEELDSLMKQLHHVRAGGRFTRNDLNKR